MSEIQDKILPTMVVARHKPLVKSPARSYEYTSAVHGDFVPCQYDLKEIARAADVESYIARSINKHREVILKEGWYLEGPEDLTEYIKKRLFQMEIMSGTSFNDFIRETVNNVVMYGTSFGVLRRDPKRSAGRVIRLHGRYLKPIAGIFPMDPTCVSVKPDKSGHPKKWKQSVRSIGGNTEKIFDGVDVIPFTLDKKTGFSFGTPYILPVLDDVRELRRAEELATFIFARYSNPIIHHTIGNDNHPLKEPLDDGTTELDIARAALDYTSAEGHFVTSWRHDIEVKGSVNETMDAIPLVQYYEQRVMSGLRLSGIDVGKGRDTSKASAVVIQQAVKEAAQDIQNLIATTLTVKFLVPLLLEGGFSPNIDRYVDFKFHEIDTEERRAEQNHGLQSFGMNVLTQDEVRRDYFNKQPLKSQDGTSLGISAEHDAKVANAKGQVQSKAQPSNQSGKKSTKTKVTANTRTSYWFALECYLSKELLQDKTKAFDVLNSVAQFYVPDQVFEGIRQLEGTISKRAFDRFMKNYIGKSFKIKLETIVDNFNKEKDDTRKSAWFVRFKEELSDLVDIQLDTAFKFGVYKAAQKQNKKVFIGDTEIDTTSRSIPYYKLISLGKPITTKE